MSFKHEKLADDLFSARNKRGNKDTLMDVSKKTGVSVATLHSIEKGERTTYNLNTIVSIAKYTGKSLCTYFQLEDEK